VKVDNFADMKKILNVISSPRGAASHSIQLAEALIGKLLITWPGSTVKTVNLADQHFPHLEEAHLVSFFTPVEQHTDEDKSAIRHSDEAIRDIMGRIFLSSAHRCIISPFLPR
jgi:FMN-dependent NADH-azoreductase